VIQEFVAMDRAWLVIVGLGLDMLGAAIVVSDLFIATKPTPLTADLTHLQQSWRDRLRKRWLGALGLLFLLLGFALQMFGQWPQG